MPGRAFGLNLRAATAGEPSRRGTIYFRFQRVSALVPPRALTPLPQADGMQRVLWHRTPSGVSVYWDPIALLRVPRLGPVRLRSRVPLPDVVPEVLNLALALSLASRGYHVLHAAAVALPPGENDRPDSLQGCVALLGPPGAGKSTLVCAAAASGLEVLSDEIVPFRLRGGRFECPGGNPHIRVAPDVARHFGAESIGERPGGKVLVDVTQCGWAAVRRRLSLRALVVLGERPRPGGPAIRAERMPPATALLKCLTNTYDSRIMPGSRRRANFTVCGAMARALPAYSLSTVEGLDNSREAAAWLGTLLRAPAMEREGSSFR